MLFPTCSFYQRTTAGTGQIWIAKLHLGVDRKASCSGTGTASQALQQHNGDQELYNKEVSHSQSSTHDREIQLDKVDQCSSFSQNSHTSVELVHI